MTWSRVPGSVLDNPKVTPAMLRVMVALGFHADKKGICYPSLGTLAERLRVTRQAVSQHINALVDAGELTKLRKTGHGNWVFEIVSLARDGGKAQLDTGKAQLEGGVKLQSLTGGKAPELEQTAQEPPSNNIGNFERFFSAYPDRPKGSQNPQAAKKEFVKLVKGGVPAETLITCAAHYAQTVRQTGTAAKYVKAANNWLSDSLWREFLEPPKPISRDSGAAI